MSLYQSQDFALAHCDAAAEERNVNADTLLEVQHRHMHHPLRLKIKTLHVMGNLGASTCQYTVKSGNLALTNVKSWLGKLQVGHRDQQGSWRHGVTTGVVSRLVP